MFTKIKKKYYVLLLCLVLCITCETSLLYTQKFDSESSNKITQQMSSGTFPYLFGSRHILWLYPSVGSEIRLSLTPLVNRNTSLLRDFPSLHSCKTAVCNAWAHVSLFFSSFMGELTGKTRMSPRASHSGLGSSRPNKEENGKKRRSKLDC
jgi:hypothetical protein